MFLIPMVNIAPPRGISQVSPMVESIYGIVELENL